MKSILKPSKRRSVTSKLLINRVERSVTKKTLDLKTEMNRSLRGKSNAFKKSFRNRYNRYINSHIRDELRKKQGRGTRKSVRFYNNLGSRI